MHPSTPFIEARAASLLLNGTQLAPLRSLLLAEETTSSPERTGDLQNQVERLVTLSGKKRRRLLVTGSRSVEGVSKVLSSSQPTLRNDLLPEHPNKKHYWNREEVI